MFLMKASSLFCRVGLVLLWITAILAVLAIVTAFTGFPGFKKFPISLPELMGLSIAGVSFYLLGQLADSLRHPKKKEVAKTQGK